MAGLCKHPNLVPGERGIVLIVAPDQKQADIVLDYIEANFRQSPILRQLIETRTLRSLKLTNRIDIEVRPSNFRTLRGPAHSIQPLTIPLPPVSTVTIAGSDWNGSRQPYRRCNSATTNSAKPSDGPSGVSNMPK